MRRILTITMALAEVVVAATLIWRRNRRLGTRLVNDFVNPALVGRGWAGKGRSEIGTVEHVGRRSGIVRRTPVHPEPTADGFRIVVPLGPESAWARNVLAAGHCRLQLHGTVYELDEPRIAAPGELDGSPRVLRVFERALGFQYLLLRRCGAWAGAREPVVAEEPVAPASPGLVTAA
jgi:deazaflavin-dependent oxidoreductase (nitroreductase family)